MTNNPSQPITNVAQGLAHLLRVFLLLQPFNGVYAKFNTEVVYRVTEHLDSFMRVPREVLDYQLRFRQGGGFPNRMRAADRDVYFSMARILQGEPNTFFSLEDGTFIGVAAKGAYAFYREAGDTFYEVPDDINASHPFWKYWGACVDDTGAPQNCTLEIGSKEAGSKDQYVECVDGCKLEPCPGQSNCSDIAETEGDECLDNLIYCPRYKYGSFGEDKDLNKTYGFIPRLYHCIDTYGVVTDEDCFFQDDVTPAHREIIGDYQYCQAKGGSGKCNPFVGNYRTAKYDARYRDWYQLIKSNLKPMWSEPAISFESFEISYSVPLFSTDEQGRRVFDGVMAMDYDLLNISMYLKNAYNETNIAVAFFERNDPNSVIATSTGNSLIYNVFDEDPTQPCPYELGTDESLTLCSPERLPMTSLVGGRIDKVLVNAFLKHKDAGHVTNTSSSPPQEPNLLTFNEEDENVGSAFFVSTISTFERPEANLFWSFVVVMPGTVSNSDSINRGDSDFALLCGVACIGAAVCFMFFVLFMHNRMERQIMMADWRFTCLFFLACTALNLVSLSFLGPSTHSSCLVRMWLFNLVFVVALSPLLAKCLRMLLLVSSPGRLAPRRKITHLQTFVMFMLPPILVQVVILTIFTFVDPSIPTQVLEMSGGFDVTQHVVCAHSSNAFYILQVVYVGSLVLGGVVLSYLTRNVESRFGEAKQLIFAMSSVLGVGAIIILFSTLMEYDYSGKKVLFAVGICWGSVISCSAFAMPRLLTALDERDASRRRSSQGTRFPSTEISQPYSRDLSARIQSMTSEQHPEGSQNQ
jgi:7 transmembrane sweet-taste receptor of 3 GCPR